MADTGRVHQQQSTPGFRPLQPVITLPFICPSQRLKTGYQVPLEARRFIKDYVEKPTGAVTLKLTAISSDHDRDFRDRQTCLFCGALLLCWAFWVIRGWQMRPRSTIHTVWCHMPFDHRNGVCFEIGDTFDCSECYLHWEFFTITVWLLFMAVFNTLD